MALNSTLFKCCDESYKITVRNRSVTQKLEKGTIKTLIFVFWGVLQKCALELEFSKAPTKNLSALSQWSSCFSPL